jgi:hypothetical protein
MHPQKEISDRIDELFCLSPGEFNPEVHLPHAEFIVRELGRKTPLIQFKDFFGYARSGTKVSDFKQKCGKYLVDHIGRLANFISDEDFLLDFHPRLSITYWKDELLQIPIGSEGLNQLDITYEGGRVVRVSMHDYFCSFIQISRSRLGISRVRKIWTYKVKRKS